MTFATRSALGSTQLPTECVPGSLSQSKSGQGVKLTTHLHLVKRLRIYGAMPLLPQCVFKAWYLVKYRDSFTFIFTCTYLSYDNIVKQMLQKNG